MWLLVEKWTKRKIKKPKTMVTALVMAIGLILILLSVNSAVSGVGISLFASGMTSLISFVFLYDEEDARAVKEWGLERVYSTRGAMNEVCDEYMKAASSIKAVGFGFRSLRDSQEGEIYKIMKKGGAVRFITMKPGSDALKLRERDEQQEICSSIEGLIAWAEEMNSRGLPGKIEIRYHDHLPQDFMFILSNRLFTGPYEYGKDSQQTVSFEYSVTGKAYEYYERRFDALWNDPSFCTDALSG